MSDQTGRNTQRPSIIPRSEHTVSRANISNNAIKVLHRLHKGGFQSFLVGGCVRDLLLRHQPKDFDVATDASPDEVRKLFRNCRLIGRRRPSAGHRSPNVRSSATISAGMSPVITSPASRSIGASEFSR